MIVDVPKPVMVPTQLATITNANSRSMSILHPYSFFSAKVWLRLFANQMLAEKHVSDAGKSTSPRAGASFQEHPIFRPIPRSPVPEFCFCTLSALCVLSVLFDNTFLFCRSHSCSAKRDIRFDQGDAERGIRCRSLFDNRVALILSPIRPHKHLLSKHDTGCEFL